MYKVYCDSYLLYDDNLESLQIIAPKLDLELNKTGSFTFTIYPDHPYFNRIHKLKSIVTVYQDDSLIFRGRVLNDEEGFYNEKLVSCEGELAFLLDSIIRPYEFTGTPESLLSSIITQHNSQVEASKQFILGNVTVTDPNDYITRADSEYTTSWDAINKKLIEMLGGYLGVRHESTGNYIDYLEDFDVLSSQKIEFAKNLIDMKRNNKADEIATVLIPLGKDGITIESVNNGLDYIENAEAVEAFGRIVKVQKWDDVELPENLLTKGAAYLTDIINILSTLEITAADLATIDEDMNSYRLGTYVRVTTNPHSIDKLFLVTKLSINLLDPVSNSLILGSTEKSMTEKQLQSYENVHAEIIRTEQANNNIADSILELQESMMSVIAQTQSEILMQVSESYYLKGDSDELVSYIDTVFTQTKEEFDFRFTEFSQNIEDVAAGMDAQFTEITKYIRFVDGNIIIGEDGNSLILRIENDRISFIDNGIEVSYFSNNRLFVTDGEFLNSLQLGNFAFIPRTNGNLSFKKI